MTADAKNPGDYGVAIRYTRKLAKKHNTKFHIMGYAYSDSVTFTVYFVDKGNNKKFNNYMQGSGVGDKSKLDLSLGNWKKYNIVMDDDGIKTEFKWEHK